MAEKTKESGVPSKSPTGRNKSIDSSNAREPKIEVEGEVALVDLCNLLPDNFSEIPYLH
jgi:hypothetical protein